jgi:hypothetical protein
MTSHADDPPRDRNQLLDEILHANPGNDCPSQRTRILSAMEQLGSVTSYESSRLLDCYDPRARIHELRTSGKNIKTLRHPERTESGLTRYIGRYILLRSNDDLQGSLELEPQLSACRLLQTKGVA